jgi:hypothetical protein
MVPQLLLVCHIQVTLATLVITPVVPMLALVVPMLAPDIVVLAASLLLLALTAGHMEPVPIPAPSVIPSFLVIRAVLPSPTCKVVVLATAIGFQLDILGLL